MKSKRLKHLQSKVVDYVRSRHEKIKVKPKQGLFNYRCYYNATQYAVDHKDFTVCEVIYIEYGVPVLHYINKSTKTGEYFETTLGYLANSLEYYLIREIKDAKETDMGDLFSVSLESWNNQFTNWFDRVIFGIDRLT